MNNKKEIEKLAPTWLAKWLGDDYKIFFHKGNAWTTRGWYFQVWSYMGGFELVFPIKKIDNGFVLADDYSSSRNF